MKKRYIWFKLSLAAGSLLGLLLLVQSLVNYYQVSRNLIAAELRREVRQQETSLERVVRRMNIQDSGELDMLLKDIREEQPQKIAWIRVINIAGQTLAQEGSAVGPPFAPARLRVAFQTGEAVSDIRETDGGKVIVAVLPMRLARRPAPESIPGEPNLAPLPGPRFVEMALYWDSASETFGTLQRNLIVSASAALGLVLSMVLLWFRFPQYVRGKQLEQQTELARQVQTDLLPPSHAVFGPLDFAAICEPAWRVGGDFYDIFAAGPEGTAIMLGDVSGDGLPAAVVVGLLIGTVRASGWWENSAEHEAAARRLSELLRAKTSLDRFASLFWCYFDPAAGSLRYVNAGHPPPLLIRGSVGAKFEIERLQEGGPVLGLLPEAEYRQGKATIREGDLLVLYSDGVVEAANASEEQFGDDGLLAAVRESGNGSSAEIRDGVLKRLRLFLSGEPLQDDLTLLVVRIGRAS